MLDMYSLYKMHGVFLGTKIKNRKQLILSYLIFYLISTCAHFVIDVPIVMLLVNVLGFFILSLNYKGNFLKRILAVVLIYAILSSIEIFVVLISGYQSLSLFEQGEFASITGIVIIKLLTYVLALVLDKFKGIRLGAVVPVSYWFCLFFVPFSCIFILFQSLNFEMLTYNMLTVEVILFLIINLSTFYFYTLLLFLPFCSKCTISFFHLIHIIARKSLCKLEQTLRGLLYTVKTVFTDCCLCIR